MPTTRREFMKAVTSGSMVAAFSPTIPSFLGKAAQAAAAAPGHDTVLVVVQLSGGNDGLNTVVPFADDAYGRSRKTLRLGARDVLRINDYLGFHPKIEGFQRMFDAGQLEIVQGVGYPQSTRDHNGAMRNWHTAHPETPGYETGWIGRVADYGVTKRGQDQIPAAFVGPIAPPFALNASQAVVPMVRAGADLTLHGPAIAPLSDPPGDNALLNAATAAARAAQDVSNHVQASLNRPASAGSYPTFTLAGQFRTIAQLLRSGVGIRVFFTEIGGGGIGGFDNHANQRDNHAALLHELSESIAAFATDLSRDGTLKRVLLMTFSEFGRTLSENGRRGTGHGEAAPMFLVGGRVRGGLTGKHPSLTDLSQDALKFHTDFRSVYASVLDQWLGFPSKAILGGDYPLVDILAKS